VKISGKKTGDSDKKRQHFMHKNNLNEVVPIFNKKRIRDLNSVARFFLVQNAKTGKKLPNHHELYKKSIKYNKRP
jgi:hypothetical protein